MASARRHLRPVSRGGAVDDILYLALAAGLFLVFGGYAVLLRRL
jgi:hypothetical protein